MTPQAQAEFEFMAQAIEAGLSSREVADQVFNAIRQERFYILTHPEVKSSVQERMEAILQERNPQNPLRASETP
jgi:hypothetical protein